MRLCFLSIGLLVFVSCKQKESNPIAVSYPIADASEWLNGDENFEIKSRKVSKTKDSTETIFTLYNDLNNDGIIDTAKAISYPHRHQTEIHFSCFQTLVLDEFISEMQLTDAGDLNGDGIHEIIILDKGSESCWDDLKLYSYSGDGWIQKYNGLTYQCIEKPMYRFIKLNDKTIQLITFGESKDSIDVASGDTLEQVLPNQQRMHIINW